jgi:hypothetical protein
VVTQVVEEPTFYTSTGTDVRPVILHDVEEPTENPADRVRELLKDGMDDVPDLYLGAGGLGGEQSVVK